MIDRRSLVGGTSLAALASLGAQMASASEATPAGADIAPVPGGTIKVGVQGDPTELDPALSNLAATELVVDLVYEGLVRIGPDLVPQPSLATSWTISDDGLTYTFTLRDGVVFHNGRAFVASDVVYSITRVMNPETASPWSPYTARIAGIEAPDDRTVVVTLNAPDASFLAALGRRGLVVVPEEAVVADGGLSQTMVGTGPFTFTSYVPNSSIVLGRNAAYWDAPKPYLDGVELQIVPDDTARTTALVQGAIDLIEAVPHKDIEILQGTEGIGLIGGKTTNLRWIVFNTRREPFDQPAVRRAIASGIDRRAIIDAAVFGYGEPLSGMYPESYWFGYQGETPDADPEGAAAALAELDLPDSFNPGLLTWSQYDFLSSSSVVVQEQLRQMGIDAEIDAQENATLIERYYTFDFDMVVMGAAGYVDPNDFIQQSFRSDEAYNAAGYANPEMDALIDQGLRSQDHDERAGIYQEIQQLLIDDAPWINLYTSSTYEGASARVQGFTHYLSGGLFGLTETWLES